jgi:2',3'-cyclic-nucleotide 2'-phosphodiesterase (5'-nucleotidase family)
MYLLNFNKKGLLNILIILVLILSIFSCSKKDTSSQTTDDQNISFSILHFNDFHAAFFTLPNTAVDNSPLWGGAAVLSGYLHKYRAEKENTIVAFAGDMFLQSPLDKASEGKFAIDVMNMFNVDIATIGNHEFDFGKERLIELLDGMQFPIISANLFDRHTSDYIVDPYKIITTKNNLKILFIGLFPEAGKGYYERAYNINIKPAFDSVLDILDLKQDEADFVAILSHLGIDDDIKLAKRLTPADGVHLIVGGHSHTLIDKIDKSLSVPIVQAGANADHIGKIDIVFDKTNNQISSLNYELVPLFADKVTPNKKINAMIEAEKNKFPDLFVPIAKTEIPLNHADRLVETALGNFVVDALVDIFNVDVAFLDSKLIRSSIPGPEINKNDIYTAFPFNNKVYKIKMTGGEIVNMLEYYMNRRQDRYISIPYTLSYSYSKIGGNKYRIEELLFKGKRINRNKIYTVAVEDRMANNFERFYNAEIIGQVAELLPDELIKYLQRIKVYSPKPANRTNKL